MMCIDGFRSMKVLLIFPFLNPIWETKDTLEQHIQSIKLALTVESQSDAQLLMSVRASSRNKVSKIPPLTRPRHPGHPIADAASGDTAALGP